DVRFKNQGLESIEVQDNGVGISPENYESVALKHYTSKLSTYSDLTTLETFGFRGEALSSLCALSRFTVTTCLQADVPKGSKLEFETSGKLKGTAVVAAQKGTTVAVENLFQNLPVRRRELERNIKREWGKVINLLNQYACIQTGVKFTVSQTPNKGKRIVLFSTKGNITTRENIINVFGAKTMGALVALDLRLELEPTTNSSQRWSNQGQSDETHEIMVKGYVSRPLHGEGRQTPDRQMFYVNSRPCGLPQFAKVFNEVYRSFNSSQSPFIFANIQLDTGLYDVNVSPDKRTILLHDQARMLDGLRDALTALFDGQDYTMPMTLITPYKQPTLKKLGSSRKETSQATPTPSQDESFKDPNAEVHLYGTDRMRNLAAAKALAKDAISPMTARVQPSQTSQEIPESAAGDNNTTLNDRLYPQEMEKTLPQPAQGPQYIIDEEPKTVMPELSEEDGEDDNIMSRVGNFKRSFLPASLQNYNDAEDAEAPEEAPIPSLPRPARLPDHVSLSSTPATSRIPKRPLQEVATITIGDHTITSVIGTPSKKQRGAESSPSSSARKRSRQASRASRPSRPAAPLPSFGGRLTQMFAAASAKQRGTVDSSISLIQVEETSDDGCDDDDDANTRTSAGERSEESTESTQMQDAEADGNALSDHSESMFVEQDEEELSVAPAADDDDNNNESQAENSPTPPQNEDYEMEDAEDGEYLEGDDEDDGNGDRTMQDADIDNEDNGGLGEQQEAQSEALEKENRKRTAAFLKGGGGARGKYSTHAFVQRLKVDEDYLRSRLETWDAAQSGYPSADQDPSSSLSCSRDGAIPDNLASGLEATNAEERLSLRIHKGDFGNMKIVGQFNLGFILAVRPRTNLTFTTNKDDELFIIDQHASDEKFNFERLQATTTVQSQRLVRPKPLELTAVEEEIIIQNQAALEKNGFVVAVDESGDEPVGSRCELLSLPLSRETAFSIADLEELISLLGEHPTSLTLTPPPLPHTTLTWSGSGDPDRDDHAGDDDGDVEDFNRAQQQQQQQQRTILNKYIPRPSKVRKMFAMRACRSSIMIGKSLSHRQMETVVKHMGEMEKPWNCPHGRPTMRHLCGLGSAWDGRLWQEGHFSDADDDSYASLTSSGTTWAKYVRERQDSP
ncbi:hypothetical protein BD289DRAFT_440753, partial [Coniella lustricola]